MNVSRNIFILKKKLIKLIEKIPVQKSDFEKKEEQIVIEILFELSGHLLRNLPIKKTAGLSKNSLYEDARAYYLYSVLGEVLSSCMSCMRVTGWVEEGEEEIKFGYPKRDPGNETISGERIQHLLHESVVDEFEVRFRKLQEYLCNLICFTQTNDQKYFQLFFSSEDLADIKFANQDINEFFGHPIENFSFQSKELLKRCKTLISELDKNKCWFLNPGVNFDTEPTQTIMSSFRQRFKKALLIANDGEKIVLGPTYKVGYGGASKSAHASVQDHLRDYTFEDVKHKIQKTPMICLNILQRISEIGKIEWPQKYIALLETARSGEGARKGIFTVTQGNYEVGDLVTTEGGDVAEIMRVDKSRYGYKCYLVKYLFNSKVQEIAEEWLPPRYIVAYLLKKNDIRNFFNLNVAPLIGAKTEVINKMTDDELYKYAKKNLLEMAKAGHIKPFFNSNTGYKILVKKG